MTTVFVLVLSLAALYFAWRWREASAENLTLREQVDSLKRRLKSATR